MATGVVARLVRDRGFGFIRTQSGSEIFFHASALAPGAFDVLAEGQEVTYEPSTDSRGRGDRAVDVRLADN